MAGHNPHYLIAAAFSIIFILLLVSTFRRPGKVKKAVELSYRLLDQHVWMSGRDLRASFNEQGLPLDGPAFYSIMAELEKRGVVRAQNEPKVVEHVELKERQFRLSQLPRH